MSHTFRHHRRSGFSLIELLTVIAIVAILAALLLPAVTGVRNSAKKSRTKATINQLSTALRAYLEEYGDWPKDAAGKVPTGTLTLTQLNALYRILSGENIDLGGGTAYPANARLISFIEVKNIDVRKVLTTETDGVFHADKNGTVDALVDAWGNTYRFAFDHDADNQTDFIYGKSGLTVTKPFAIWSASIDEMVDPTETNAIEPVRQKNRDNITSWN